MDSKREVDVLIIGGGLAGLVSAIHLLRAGRSVTLVEKYAYPRHKVCGEYISNEVLPYLKSLGLDPFSLGAKSIERLQLTTVKSKVIEADLPLGGFGISRYTLDYSLYKLACEQGLEFIEDKVTEVAFNANRFEVRTRRNRSFESAIVIGAFGKRSALDKKMEREFVKHESPYLAVKAHYEGEFPDDLVALHNFKGGYCGVSKVENDAINLCYITDYQAFKKFKNIDEFQAQVLCKNAHLKEILQHSRMVFESPLTISQISFSKKKSIEQHMLMCGDSAGMIHPLCGNGMSMAIHSAQIASEAIIDYFNSSDRNRALLEKNYSNRWNAAFQSRLRTGRLLASLFRSDRMSATMLSGLKAVPALLPQIIKRTHGEALQAYSIC
jgi:flavin-dependent dehydrogenase